MVSLKAIGRAVVACARAQGLWGLPPMLCPNALGGGMIMDDAHIVEKTHTGDRLASSSA